jgi:hypothetical protein
LAIIFAWSGGEKQSLLPPGEPGGGESDTITLLLAATASPFFTCFGSALRVVPEITAAIFAAFTTGFRGSLAIFREIT